MFYPETEFIYKEPEECPTCTGQNGRMGLGAIIDDSWAAGGKGWHECYDCDGTGFVIDPEPNELLKKLL